MKHAVATTSTRRPSFPRSAASYLFSLFWIGVCLLHGVLVLRRLAGAEWDIAVFLRVALGLSGVTYASLKLGRVRTLFDQGPRRAALFAFMLVLMHATVTAPATHAEPGRPIAAVVILGAPILLALLSGRFTKAPPAPTRTRRARAPRPVASFDLIPVATGLLSFALHRRPPPPATALA